MTGSGHRAGRRFDRRDPVQQSRLQLRVGQHRRRLVFDRKALLLLVAIGIARIVSLHTESLQLMPSAAPQKSYEPSCRWLTSSVSVVSGRLSMKQDSRRPMPACFERWLERDLGQESIAELTIGIMTSQTTRNDCANARRTSSLRGSSLFKERQHQARGRFCPNQR